jgi:hypothetical protein
MKAMLSRVGLNELLDGCATRTPLLYDLTSPFAAVER